MKIGYYGGAFDPFHAEHKHIIESAKKELGLDKVIVYPSYLSPHKTCTAPYEARREMVEAATKNLGYVVIDDIEKDRGKNVNPTAEILPLLKEKYKSDESYFIIGGDSIINFHSWVRPQDVAKTMKIAVVTREHTGETGEAVNFARENYGAEIIVLSYVGKCVSGSMLKAELELGEVPEELEKEVYDIIINRGLYSERKELVEKLKSNIPEKTFEHCKRTVYYAMKLNVKLGLDYGKVFTAALLHDCAKHIRRGTEGIPQAVEHQFVGREIAQNEYGISDEEILSAIEYHTTGRAGMSKLEKLIYCADMLEEGRNYPGAEELRKETENDFDKGFLSCVKKSLKFIEDKGNPVYGLTKECVRYYNQG